MLRLPSVGIIGAGRVGSALALGLRAAGVPVVGIASRTSAHATALATSANIPSLDASQVLSNADLTVLAVRDDVIAECAAALISTPVRVGQAVVHCSGALGLEPLAGLADAGWLTGAWHPLQAFATTSTPLQTGITWGITASSELQAQLISLTTTLGGRPQTIAAESKGRYHAAAVLAANYAITLAAQAVDVLETCGFSRDGALAALLPLLHGNLATLERVGLPMALTGPLVRGDSATIERHLNDLAGDPTAKALYQACGLATVPLLKERGLDDPTIERLARILHP